MCELGLLQQADLAISPCFFALTHSKICTTGYRLGVMTMTDTREHALRVWVTPEEKAVIDQHAKATCMSCSGYLRTLGVGYVPPSKLDALQMRELAKVNADMGRLGGLLKMLLTNQERRTAELDQQLESLLNQITAAQADLWSIAQRLKK